MGLLPTNKSIKKNDNPRNLIMFGLPKVGKTTVLSQLPDCLIIDLENGSDYIEGFSVKASNYKELQAIARALRDEEHHFKFVALDTVTALEEMAMPVACKLYQDTPRQTWAA
jgi:predicted AAA+ superfamily ATPase